MMFILPGLLLIDASSFWAAFLAAALLAIIFVAPIEYALGSLACAFVAACSGELASAFQTLRWTMLGAGAIILSLRFFLRKRVTASASRTPSKFTFLVTAFILISAGTTLTSVAPRLAALKLGAFVCLFYVTSRAVWHVVETYGPASPRYLVRGLLFYPLGFIIVALFRHWFFLGGSAAGRFHGYLGNPNSWGGLVAITLPWVACPSFRQPRASRTMQALSAVGLLVLAYTLLLSGSRSGILSVLSALVFFSTVHAHRRITAVVLLISVTITMEALARPDLIAELSGKYFYKYNAEGERDVFRSRAESWDTARRNFHENPWLGLGFGVTNKAESEWTFDVRSGPRATETGSSFWGALVQVGILGASPLFLSILLLLIAAGRFAFRVKNCWLTGIYGSALALTVNALFEGWLIAPGGLTTTYFWIQCFFLNALICRYRPAPARPRFVPMLQVAEGYAPGPAGYAPGRR